jgi:ribosomal-protein-alanine N-acetyltransferase
VKPSARPSPSTAAASIAPPLRRPYALRPMCVEDVTTVMTIERAGHRFPWTEGNLRDCLRAGNACWVWDEAGILKAFGVMSVGAGEAHILNLCTHPLHQRRGIGRKLLSQLLSLAVRHRAEVVFLEVRVDNQPALRLYRRMGFNEVGVRKGYYPGINGRQDALVLARSFLTANL